jgi:hypothetical protein
MEKYLMDITNIIKDEIVDMIKIIKKSINILLISSLLV